MEGAVRRGQAPAGQRGSGPTRRSTRTSSGALARLTGGDPAVTRLTHSGDDAFTQPAYTGHHAFTQLTGGDHAFTRLTHGGRTRTGLSPGDGGCG